MELIQKRWIISTIINGRRKNCSYFYPLLFPFPKPKFPNTPCGRKIKKEWRGLLAITPTVVAAVETYVDVAQGTSRTMS